MQNVTTAKLPDSPPGAVRRLLRAGQTLAEAGILLYGLTMIGYLLARLAVGERWNWVAFANNFVPWWALGSLGCAGIALVSRRRWLLIAPQVPIIAAFLILYGDLLLPPDHPAEAGGAPVLIVATYNIKSATSDPQRIIDVVASLNADIIGLQEVGPVHAERLGQAFAREYPYQAWHPGLPVHGVGLLSRYPILQEAVILPFPDSMYFLRVELDVNGVPVTVYVAHPAIPHPFLSPLTYSDERRDREIAILRKSYLVHETGPLVVLGDFNMTDQSDSYHALDAQLDDAFRTVGRGLGLTFPDQLLPRLLRLDYIWYNADFAALNVRTAPDGGTSDHRPVTATLVLRKDSAPE
jgi:endonuclease/exonuclease/phosphatase family metal-dependent hydrolase